MGKRRRIRDAKAGRVVETVGRRVRVHDDEGERVCFLSGQRAVVGDVVRWVEAKGSGGKLVGVEARHTVLARRDFSGREQVLAANLGGILIVAAVQEPPFRAGLVDRYLVAAGVGGLDAAILLNKTDLGVPEEVEAAAALREEEGIPVLRVSAQTGEGIDPLRSFLAEHASDAPWALVGHSGVGKTSVIAALLPDDDVGPVGELSDYWGTGQHTTTNSRLFELPTGGELVDSPGIRTFTPGMVDPEEVRLHFPGIAYLQCKYRNCLHRSGEDGCVAEERVPEALLTSYRRLLADVTTLDEKRRP